MDHVLNNEEVEAIKAGRSYLIDVRSSGEVAEKSCKFAMHWDVQQMVEGRFPNIPKDRPIFLFCRSGSRSSTAQRLLGAQGYTDAHDIGSIDSIPAELL